jgi:hypothetical protein
MTKIISLILLVVPIIGCRSHLARKHVYYVTFTDQAGVDRFLSSCGKPEIKLEAGQYYVHTFGGNGGVDAYFVTKAATSAPSSTSNDSCEPNP